MGCVVVTRVSKHPDVNGQGYRALWQTRYRFRRKQGRDMTARSSKELFASQVSSVASTNSSRHEGKKTNSREGHAERERDTQSPAYVLEYYKRRSRCQSLASTVRRKPNQKLDYSSFDVYTLIAPVVLNSLLLLRVCADAYFFAVLISSAFRA